MFSANEQLDRAVKAVVELTTKFDRGDILPFPQIEKAADCRRYEGRWGTIIRKVRRAILRDRGIAFRPVVSKGYKLLTLEEQVTLPARDRRRRASRQITTGIKEISGADDPSLPLHLQVQRTVSIRAMTQERREVKRGMREQLEMKRTETIPSRWFSEKAKG